MKKLSLCLGLCLVACAALAAAPKLAPPAAAEQPAPAAPPAPEAARPDAPAPASGPAQTPPATPSSPVWASAEVRFPNYFSSLFYAFHSGDPVEFRLLLHNVSKEPVEVPKDLDLRAHIRAETQDGRKLEPSAGDPWKDAIASRLAPGQILGGLFNLSEVFPDMKKPGGFAIHWEAGDWKSNQVVVRTIERYNRQADYEATLETGEGNITLELYGREAPVHVGNFVNLARLGYYDGMPFHTISRERSIRTGAPGPDGTGSIGYSLPAEISSHRHLAGAVSMYRDQRRPGTDSDGTQFFICLTDLPNRDGKFTIFGQVKKGLEVAKKIGSRETVTDPARPANTPREPVKIHRIEIVEKPRAAQG